MTTEEISRTPAAAVSTTPDTDSICFWLKEIWKQLVRTNEFLSLLVKK